MSVAIDWKEILLRIALATVGGMLVGFNRGEHGRPAGMRTTLLVCLAATIAMIQANLLMSTVGRRSDSFVNLDLMRLPLGILSGMGFIGAGAIIRRGDLVLGLTTAATLWFVTVMGLCFGGGQLGLGCTALGLAMLTLWGLKGVEERIPQECRGLLTLCLQGRDVDEKQVRRQLERHGAQVASWGFNYSQREQAYTLHCVVQWYMRHGESSLPEFLREWIGKEGVVKVQWQPQRSIPDSVEITNQPLTLQSINSPPAAS